MIKMLKRLGKFWWLVVLMVFTILFNVAFDFLIPYFLGQVVTTLQNNGGAKVDVWAVARPSILMAVSAFLGGAASLATGKLASIVTARIIAATRYDFYKKIGEFSSDEMNKFSVSSLVTRTTSDLTMIGNTYNLVFRFLLYGPIISITAMVILVVSLPNARILTLCVFVALLVMLVFMGILIGVAMPKYQSIQQKLDKVNLVTRENLEGLRVVRAYNAEDFQEKKFQKINNVLMKTERFANKALGLLLPGIQLIVGLLVVVLYFVSADLIKKGTPGFEYSALTVAIQYAFLMLTGFVMMTVLIVSLPRTLVCAKRVNEVIYTKPSVTDSPNPVTPTEVGTIEFRNVTFSYPGAEKPVLENISFSVKKGQTIAFIGATGAGKTTIVNLMTRFFDPTSGEVLVDGVQTKDYVVNDLLSRFGYVPQKGYLFHDTLVNNITVGKPDANPSQIKRALDIAQASEFVSKLPGGLDYEISQGGKNVSGGQRQRLCIARAIIMEPEIFIFDDSFSALDYRTDKILRGEIKKQCAGTTNVIVAQRVGTILDADIIVCLDAGKVAGIGTHAELLDTCEVYHDIALSQLSKEELENTKAESKKNKKEGK